MSTYTTRKQRYPGAAVIDAEFAAAATPEQLALVASIANGSWSDTDPYRGLWSFYDITAGRDVLQFLRPTGEIYVWDAS